MKEINKLYEKLHTASKQEREQLWNLIIKKNRFLFDKRREELNKLFEEI